MAYHRLASGTFFSNKGELIRVWVSNYIYVIQCDVLTVSYPDQNNGLAIKPPVELGHW